MVKIILAGLWMAQLCWSSDVPLSSQTFLSKSAVCSVSASGFFGHLMSLWVVESCGYINRGQAGAGWRQQQGWVCFSELNLWQSTVPFPFPACSCYWASDLQDNWKSRKIWLAGLHRELVRLCTHQCCRSGMCHRNVGQPHLSLLSPRNAVAEGGQDARLMQCLPTGDEAWQIRGQNPHHCLVGLAWGNCWVLPWAGNPALCGVGHKESWDVPVAVQVCQSVLGDWSPRDTGTDRESSGTEMLLPVWHHHGPKNNICHKSLVYVLLKSRLPLLWYQPDCAIPVPSAVETWMGLRLL